MWSALRSSVMKNGSCAIESREPCQVGNQAALNGIFDVPRGCLFGAGGGVNAWKRIVDLEVYDLIGHLNKKGECVPYTVRFRFFIFTGWEDVYVQGFISKMAACGF